MRCLLPHRVLWWLNKSAEVSVQVLPSREHLLLEEGWRFSGSSGLSGVGAGRTWLPSLATHGPLQTQVFFCRLRMQSWILFSQDTGSLSLTGGLPGFNFAPLACSLTFSLHRPSFSCVWIYYPRKKMSAFTGGRFLSSASLSVHDTVC